MVIGDNLAISFFKDCLNLAATVLFQSQIIKIQNYGKDFQQSITNLLGSNLSQPAYMSREFLPICQGQPAVHRERAIQLCIERIAQAKSKK